MIEVGVNHLPALFLNRGVLGSVACTGDIDDRASRNLHSLNLKASSCGYGAEIDDRHFAGVSVAAGVVQECPSLRHRGREFRLDRRVVRRLDENYRRGAVLADLRSKNHILFPEARDNAL